MVLTKKDDNHKDSYIGIFEETVKERFNKIKELAKEK